MGVAERIFLAGFEVRVAGEAQGPPSAEQLQALLEFAGSPLPPEYLEEIGQHDGLAGMIGDEDEPGFVSLLSCSDVVSINSTYEFRENGGVLLAVGGDGGGEAYAIDLQTSEWVVVSWVDLGLGQHEIRFASLAALLKAIASGTVYSEER